MQTRALEYHVTDTSNLRCDHRCSYSPILEKWCADPAQFEKDLPFGPDEEAVAEHLTAPYFYFTLMPFANLARFEGGHYLTPRGLHSYRSGRAGGYLLTALRRAARASTLGGLFLSGGLDSSLPAAVAEPPLPAFTINSGTMDYTDSLIVNSDDGPFARQVAVAFRSSSFRSHPARLCYRAPARAMGQRPDRGLGAGCLAELGRRSCRATLQSSISSAIGSFLPQT